MFFVDDAVSGSLASCQPGKVLAATLVDVQVVAESEVALGQFTALPSLRGTKTLGGLTGRCPGWSKGLPLMSRNRPPQDWAEPWSLQDEDETIVDAKLINVVVSGGGGWRQDARRIVACVNACKGIPTDQLEQRFVHVHPGAFMISIVR